MHAVALTYSPADPYNPAGVPATISEVVLAKLRIRGNATQVLPRNRPPVLSSAGGLTSRGRWNSRAIARSELLSAEFAMLAQFGDPGSSEDKS